MTERLSDITDRIEGIRQLGAVVSAMRGIAAARAEQARSQIVAVDSYAASIAAAIGQVLALAPAAPSQADGKPARLALVVFCAEQGFAGAFSERVLDQAGADLVTSEIFLIGTRGRIAIAERDVVPGWTAALPSHSPGIPKLADTIGTALYARIAAGKIDRLDAIYNQWQPGKGIAVQRRALFPLDLSLFPRVESATPPLLNLPPDELIRSLAADYLMLSSAAPRSTPLQPRTRHACRRWPQRAIRSRSNWQRSRPGNGWCGRRKSQPRSSNLPPERPPAGWDDGRKDGMDARAHRICGTGWLVS